VVVSTDQTVKSIAKIPVYKAFPRLDSYVFVDIATYLSMLLQNCGFKPELRHAFWEGSRTGM